MAWDNLDIQSLLKSLKNVFYEEKIKKAFNLLSNGKFVNLEELTLNNINFGLTLQFTEFKIPTLTTVIINGCDVMPFNKNSQLPKLRFLFIKNVSQMKIYHIPFLPALLRLHIDNVKYDMEALYLLQKNTPRLQEFYLDEIWEYNDSLLWLLSQWKNIKLFHLKIENRYHCLVGNNYQLFINHIKEIGNMSEKNTSITISIDLISISHHGIYKEMQKIREMYDKMEINI